MAWPASRRPLSGGVCSDGEVSDPATRSRLEALRIGPGWQCLEVGAGADSIGLSVVQQARTSCDGSAMTVEGTPAPVRIVGASDTVFSVDYDQVAVAMEPLRSLLRPDGGDLELVAVDAATGGVRLRLLLEDASCAECVMPQSHLEQVAATVLRRTLPEVQTITVDDPRAPAGPPEGRDDGGQS
jgi:Fe-S cluster biogenesis protein NfuA